MTRHSMTMPGNINRIALQRWPRHLVVLAGIVILATVLRFHALGRESLWFDEAFSTSVANWDPRWIILKLTELGLRSTDRNVFHLMLHYALLLGQSEVIVRSIPAISGVLSVAALYALGKRLLGQSTGLLAAFLLAISPMHVYYSREGRGYALLALFGLLAAYFMLRALADKSALSWLAYIVLAALAAYTHSFGLLIIAALNLFAVVRLAMRRSVARELAVWFVAQVALGLLLLPLILEFTGQTSEGWGAWIEKYGVPTIKTLGLTMGQFSFGVAYGQNRALYAVALAVFAIFCLAALVNVLLRRMQPGWWNQDAEPMAFALIYLAAPIAALFLVSQITPLYLERYLLPFVPPYLLIVARGILTVRQGKLRVLAVLVVLIVTIPGLLAVYQPGQKENWRAGAAYVAANVGANDMIVIYDAYASIPFNFYYHGDIRQLPISRFASDEEMAQHAAVVAAMHDRVWVVLSHADESRLKTFFEARPGVRRTAEKRFLGLSIVTYDVSPPP